MSGFEKIRQALKDTLTENGVSAAICEYPYGGKGRYTRPILTVGLKNGMGSPSGFKEYLGEISHDETGLVREIYGQKLDVTFGLHIYSPQSEEQGAAGCAKLLSEIAGALENLPGGLKVKELNWGETDFDAKLGMFHCETELKCTAYLYAEMTEEGEFLDFELKGKVTI